MTSASVKADIENALDQIKADDPDFQYEIEMPPDPKHRVSTVVMEPFDLPKDQYILDAVLSPNPPMDRDGRGEDTGRGRGSNRRGWSGLEFG